MQSIIERISNVTPDWDSWVSATKTRNWMEEDPLLDWLNLYGAENKFAKDSELPTYIAEADFGEFVMRKGREFEAKVLDLLAKRLNAVRLTPIYTVAKSGEDSRSKEHWQETVSQMQAATPVIAQGVLWDWEHGTYGMPDLLVRSDILHHLCDGDLDYAAIGVGAPELGLADRHYVVIDIKFRGMHLASNGEADNNAKHYKVQLAIYNAALGLVQGFSPPQAFFLGRGWEKGSGKNHEKCSNCLDRLVPVSLPLQDQRGRDPIDWLERAMEAVDWIRKVRREGSTWQALPVPSNKWMHPNMKNTQDGPWHKAKSDISKAIGEPSRIWNLGLDVRNQLIEAGSGDWRDANFRSDIAAPGTTPTEVRLRQMLSINRDANGPKHLPAVIDWVREEWADSEPLEFFVDFETTSNLDDDFSSLPQTGGQPLIFMIGCGHWEPIAADPGDHRDWMLDSSKRKWVFKPFYTESLTESAEKEMILKWYRYMEEVRARINGAPARPKVFHWSPAETRTYSMGSDSAFVRHLQPTGWPDPNWYDFLGNVVKPKGSSNAFFVKGAWGFGLKTISNALNDHGFIQAKWADGSADGLSAMSGSWTCYRSAKDQGISVKDVVLKDNSGAEHRLFQEIIDYNEVDCRTMAEAIQFIRSL